MNLEGFPFLKFKNMIDFKWMDGKKDIPWKW